MRPVAFPVERRFQWGPVPGVPFYMMSTAILAVPETWAAVGISFPESHLFFRTGSAWWFNNQVELERLGLEAARRLTNPADPLAHAYTEYEQIVGALHEVETLPIDSATITHAELLDRFTELHQLGRAFWQRAILPELAGYGIGPYLERQLPQAIPTLNLQDALIVLTSPDRPSFFQVEELALLALVAHGSPDPVPLIEHTRRYAWLLGNYASNAPLTERYFSERATQLLAATASPSQAIERIDAQVKATNQRRTEILAALPAGELQTLARSAGFFVGWHDQRKSEQLRFQLRFHHLLTAASRILAIPFKDLLYWIDREVIVALQGGPVVSAALTAERRTLSFGWLPTHGAGELVVGSQVQRLFNTYQSTGNVVPTTELRGTVVSSGSGRPIRGVARLLVHPSDGHRVANGEILVAAMTSTTSL